MNTAPAPQPTTIPALGEWAPLPVAGAAPDKIRLTRTQKVLIGVVAAGAVAIAAIGFAGSYTAVRDLAAAKGFGWFATWLPLGIDIGIGVFLALDLLLTWLRMPYPLLRQGAWLLTASTIAFNAAAAWPDPLGVGMHAVIPILFVIAVEAARHAVGRIADITADKHLEGPNASRWVLNPLGTFVLWRRQRLWGIRTWDQVLELERERRIYVGKLRKEHGRGWRRKAGADQLLVLRLAKDGMSIQEAIDLPKREAEKQAEAEAKREAEACARAEAEAEAKHQAELRNAEVEAKRRAELAEAEAAEAEAKYRAEAAAEALRLEVEAKQRREAEAARLLVAETEAKLAEIARQQREAEAEAEAKRRQREAEEARRRAEAARAEQQRQAREAEERRRAEAAEKAKRIASEALRANAASVPAPEAGATPKPKSTSTSAPGSGPANLGGQRSKRAAEVEAVLARITEAADPEAVSLKWVMEHFDLKQTTAYDRLATAQKLWRDAQAA